MGKFPPFIRRSTQPPTSTEMPCLQLRSSTLAAASGTLDQVCRIAHILSSIRFTRLADRSPENMATRAQKLRLALFFIVSAGLLIVFLIVVAGSHLLEKRDGYIVEFEDIPVGGLNKGAAVKYQGIKVGRVDNTYISPTNVTTVVVEISVEPEKVPNAIRTDTRASIYNQGITGLKYIELIAGSQDAEILPPGSRIRASDSFLSNLEERADVLTQKIEQTLNNVILLTGDENQRQFTRALTRAGELMENANLLVEENRAPLNATFENLAQTTRSLAGATASFEGTMDSLHQMLVVEGTAQDVQIAASQLRLQLERPLPALIARMDTMFTTIDQTFTHIDRTVVQSRVNVLRAMQDLEETLQNVREITEIIRENPAVLIRGGSRD